MMKGFFSGLEHRTIRMKASEVREESWPFLCHVDLSSYKGLQVTWKGWSDLRGESFGVELWIE